MIVIYFLSLVRGKVLFNELLSRHTSFKIGGPAEIWIEPADVIELRLYTLPMRG